jgi:hypothetical protein
MKKSIFIFLLFLTSCVSTSPSLQYGYLPGGDYQYYKSRNQVDLKGNTYRLEVYDQRIESHVGCANVHVPRDTELEGSFGMEYFSYYLRAMIEFNNGKVDPKSTNVLKVDLKAISGDLVGFVYGRVIGIIEFNANIGQLKKKYCNIMADGDEGSPVGKYAFDTRRGAFRKLVAGSTRDALEKLMQDLQGQLNDSYI